MRPFPRVVAGLLLCLLAAGASAQILDCNPCSYDFGSVKIGKSSSASVWLVNTSSQTVTVLSKSLKGSAFSFGNFPLPVQIDARSSIELPIIFTPSAVGAANGTITIKSDALNSPLTIDVSGRGTGGSGAQLAVSPATLNFGKVSVGSSAKLQATLTASNGALTISADSSDDSQFAIEGLTLPAKLPAGESITFTIQFTPSASGAASAQATFVSNAVNSPTIEDLSGTGVAQAKSQLTISPATLAFGNVAVGSSASLQATLTASNAAVKISSDQVSSEFAIIGLTLPTTLKAGQSLGVTIQFTPSAAGAASGQAEFISNANDSPTIAQLSGTGEGSGSHSVSLSWDPGDGNAVGYNVYRGTTKGGPYTMINTALEATTNYTDYTVASGTTYYYAATEVNAQGQESGYSNIAKAVIPK